MKKLNVLFINHSVRDGGPGRSLFYILKYIDRQKINPYVLIPKDDIFSSLLRSENLYKNIVIENRFPENVLRPRLNSVFNNNFINNSYLLSRISKIVSILLNVVDLIIFVFTSGRLLERNNIKVIYCNGTLAKIVGVLIGRVNDTSVIWHVRNIQQNSIMKYLMNWLSGLRVLKRIICVSGPTANQFYKNKNKLVIINNGIDLDDYNQDNTAGKLRMEFSILKTDIVVGTVGRIVPRKKYENLVYSAKYIRDNTGDEFKRIKFAVVGDTPYFFQKNHLEEIKATVKKENLNDSFIFTGYTKDVREYLKDFNIFVITSDYPDPFPRSVIEAMSFSLPVVGFRIGGISESVSDGITGILSDPDDLRGMSDAILELIKDKEKRVSMGKKGRDRIKELYQAKDIASRIQEQIQLASTS